VHCAFPGKHFLKLWRDLKEEQGVSISDFYLWYLTTDVPEVKKGRERLWSDHFGKIQRVLDRVLEKCGPAHDSLRVWTAFS
jgi:hypothetical protein